MTFLMTLFVILLSMLMILFSTLSVIRYLICGNNLSWLLNLHLIYKILWTGAESDLWISILEKLNLLRLTSLITLVSLMWKWMGLLRKNYLLRCWLGLFNCLYCWNYCQENWRFYSFYEVSFSWGCSLSR